MAGGADGPHGRCASGRCRVHSLHIVAKNLDILVIATYVASQQFQQNTLGGHFPELTLLSSDIFIEVGHLTTWILLLIQSQTSITELASPKSVLSANVASVQFVGVI